MAESMKLPTRNYAMEQIIVVVVFFFSFHLNYYMLVVQSTLLHYENVK